MAARGGVVGALLLLAAAGAAAQSSEERGLAIATEADARASGWGDSTATIDMTLIASDGDEARRALRVRSLEVAGDGDKSLAIFDSPRDIAGTAVLTHAHPASADDQWLYLPALKRVKRIAAANQTSPFMGSEFTYEDLVSDVLEKYTYRWLRDEPCPTDEAQALQCAVVERIPILDTSGYSRQVVWLDLDQYRAWRIDYYDRRQMLEKTLTYGEYRQYLGSIWRALDMHMVSYRTGRETRLRWADLEFGAGLDDSDFTTDDLRRAR